MTSSSERADDGVATVWAAAGTAVIMAALLVALHLGAAVVARHQAESAADLAALAAAGAAYLGDDAACARAEEIASAMHATVRSCSVSGWEVLLEARVAVPLTFPGATPEATGRARAAPVTEVGGSHAVPLPRRTVTRAWWMAPRHRSRKRHAQ
jgi:secretion/DNA translocation related TadE-like protein